jgi:hypothetical protein
MVNEAETFLTAQLAIEQHGADARKYAEGEMQRFAEEDDLQGTQFWLAVGDAIDALNNPVTVSEDGTAASFYSRVFRTTRG